MKTIFFDLDDTLIKTAKHYFFAEKKFIKLFSEFNIKENELLDLIKEADLELIKSHKYGYLWYCRGLESVYKKLSKKYNFIINDMSNEINNIINFEFKSKRELRDNVLEVLEFFSDKKFNLYIMTLGDNKIQKEKIENAGIKKFFKNIFIVSRKNDKDYQTIISKTEINPAESYFVGNSIESDMIPALKAGFKCILLNKHTSFYNKKINIPEKIMVIENLIELIEIIK